MNRRKKIIKKLLKKAKQARAKKQPKKKNHYIAKVDREAQEVTECSKKTEAEPKIESICNN